MSVARGNPNISAWHAYLQWRRFGNRPPRDFSLRRRLLFAAGSLGVRGFSRVASASCAMSVQGDSNFRMGVLRDCANVIWLMWHNRVPGFFTYYDLMARRNPLIRVSCIVSASMDGELLARPFRETGGGDIRGSSSSGGAPALRQAVESRAAIATVGDGPRGPRYELKPGPILLAKATGMPIVPCAWSCTRVAQLYRSWDQLMIPLPYSRIHFRFDEPVPVPADASAADISALRRELEQRMMRLTQWADANTRVAWPIPKPRPGEVLKRRAQQGLATRRR